MPVRISPGGGSVTPVNVDVTAVSGTPSSIADEAVMDAGMLSGWVVDDPNAALNSVVDDGAKLTVTFDQGTGATTQFTSGNARLTQPLFRYPRRLMADFVFGAKIKNPASTANADTQAAVCSGCGTVNNQAHNFVQLLGKEQTANAAYFGYACADSGALAYSGTNALSRTTARWVGIRRVGGDIYFGEGGTGDDPSWSWTITQWDTAGGAPWMYIGFYAGSTTEETYEIERVILTGYEYTASPV